MAQLVQTEYHCAAGTGLNPAPPKFNAGVKNPSVDPTTNQFPLLACKTAALGLAVPIIVSRDRRKPCPAKNQCHIEKPCTRSHRKPVSGTRVIHCRIGYTVPIIVPSHRSKPRPAKIQMRC